MKNYLGLLFGNVLALGFIIGIFAPVIKTFVSENLYNEENQYVWVVAFFGSQILAFLVTDFIALGLMALLVSKGFVGHKTCLAYLMRESLYIYEDYKYVWQFTHTKIS